MNKNSVHAGFTFLEMMVSLLVLVAVSGIVMGGMVQLMRTQSTIANRTEMHTSVRSATELLQQEIGQAGKVSLPNPVTMLTAVATPGTQSVTVSSGSGMFNGEQLVIDAGSNQETVTISGFTTGGNSFSANFSNAHATGVAVSALGAFATGIVPPASPDNPPGIAAFVNGSTGSVLKLYGDINGDGNMVYVEYQCDTVNGFLYRNQMAFDLSARPTGSKMRLLDNIIPNPPDKAGIVAPCFTYQAKPVGQYTFVTDVAVTITEQAQNLDPQTHIRYTETKALLNVSPRNVYNAWELANSDLINRVQDMPATVTAFISQVP